MPKPTTPLPLPTCQRSSILWLQIITRLLIDTFNIVYNVSHWFHGMELFFWSKNKIRGIISITQRRNTSLMKYQYMDLMDPFKVTKPWELKKIMQRTSELYSHTSQFIWIFNEYVCVCVFDSRDWYPHPLSFPRISSYSPPPRASGVFRIK